MELSKLNQIRLKHTEISIQKLIQNSAQAQKRQYDEKKMKEDKELLNLSVEQMREQLNKSQKQVVSSNDDNVQKLKGVDN